MIGPVSTAESVSLDETAEARTPKETPDPTPNAAETPATTGGDDDEDDTLSYFQKLAAQD